MNNNSQFKKGFESVYLPVWGASYVHVPEMKGKVFYQLTLTLKSPFPPKKEEK